MSMMIHRAGLVMLVSATAAATAGPTLITFDGLNSGTRVQDQFTNLGISFNGDVLSSINFGDFQFEDPTVSNLVNLFGSDPDPEAVAASFFGIGSSTIAFSAVEGTYFSNLSFDLVRQATQDITIFVTGNDFEPVTITFERLSGFGSLFRVDTFEIQLSLAVAHILGVSADGLEITSVAIRNGGNKFGLDNLRFESVALIVPLPGPALMAGLGLASVASRRRR